ncbi:MAG TPA: lipid II flippase MurJ, partial [Pirellulales bacterium]|nr:lipid II flippase MurJ [Pirellulales bacterium]
WGLSAPAEGAEQIAWLGGAIGYPLEPGAAAAIYYGERLYQFPLGLLGMAVATVIFPALSRHAARGQFDRLGEDLTLGVRLVLFLAVPAGAGLVLISDPLARLLFEHGEFTAADAARVGRMIACYALGVWAFCAAPVIVRGYYALGDQQTPLKTGAIAMLVNLLLNLALIWPLAEAGLALSTSLSAMLQVGLLLRRFSRHGGYLGWAEMGRTAVVTLAATACMLLAGYAAMACIPQAPGNVYVLARVATPILIGSAVFLAASRWFKAEELQFLLGRQPTAE